MTIAGGNFEEIRLSDDRFAAIAPSNDEIGAIYALSENLVQRFAAEIREAAYELTQGRSLSARQRAVLRLSDARIVWRLIYEYTQAPEMEAGYEIVGVRDGDGNLQAGAIINLDFGDFVYVQCFATAPFNILGSDFDRRAVKNAGRSLMELIVKYGINQGFDGTVKLLSKERAVSFYAQLGFQKDVNNEDLLILTSGKAREFLANQ